MVLNHGISIATCDYRAVNEDMTLGAAKISIIHKPSLSESMMIRLMIKT
jgi:hypothetical protein